MQLAFSLNHFLCAVVKVQAVPAFSLGRNCIQVFLLNPESDTEPIFANSKQYSVDAVRLFVNPRFAFALPCLTRMCFRFHASCCLLDSSWRISSRRFLRVFFRSTSRMKLKHFCSRLLLRKEVIQPHLPIRLPCYDFTPVIGLALGGWLPKVTSPTLGTPNSHGVTGGVYKARERIHRGMLIRDY